MPKSEEEIYAYCQYCKEKKQMTRDYVLNDGKTRTLRGKCMTCENPIQLVVPKGFKL